MKVVSALLLVSGLVVCGETASAMPPFNTPWYSSYSPDVNLSLRTTTTSNVSTPFFQIEDLLSPSFIFFLLFRTKYIARYTSNNPHAAAARHWVGIHTYIGIRRSISRPSSVTCKLQ